MLIPRPMDAACIIRASCPPPMMPTVKVRPLVTRGSVPVTMTGSLRRLQELAACCVQSWLLFASDEGGASMAARQSAVNTAHCSLKITERCTMKLTVVATP